ncbi:MATE efflux family protein [Rhizopus microsporus ATCC 52813]|uniref:MATE efflux family protein n=1 Tax=Rhizopus microsporus ATCC 52813 TaxID=1340429 RepID=A0A2G4SF50_RHIZD|nr:MATE efflux family protein [Rhizopus microsporus ATCC 52813]PHZ07404.1 MATE efflux family protein [Rhizopus microsporus ATCC 52813]
MMRAPSLLMYSKLMSKDRESEPLCYENDMKKMPCRKDSGYDSISSPIEMPYPLTSLDVLQEAKAVLRYSIPLAITFFLGYSTRATDVWFLGKLGPQGISIGNGILTGKEKKEAVIRKVLTPFSRVAIDTLVAQAFTGAKHHHTVGIILQRGLLVSFIFGIMISVLWANSEFILVLMGQDPMLANMAQTYIIILIPYLFICYANTALRKFLQSIGEMKVTLYLVFFLLPANVVSNYFFLEYLNLGYIGAALHIVFISAFITLLYTIYLTCITNLIQVYWPGLTLNAFGGWSEFLRLGIPGMLSLSTDWAFEVCALLTGVLGQTSLAAQSVVLTINTLLLMIPTALSTGMAVRLGHLLGANEPRKSNLCFMVSAGIGVLCTFINALAIFTYRSQIAHHFSSDSEVVEATINLLQVASACHFTMGIGIVFSYALNALGKQTIVASLNVVSYYMIGLPFGIYLTYQCDWGLEGIWAGVALSGIVKVLCEFSILTYLVDWRHECQLATNRIHDQEYATSFIV